MYVNSISLVKCVSWVGEHRHITRDMCFVVGKHISLGIYVSCVGEQISQGIKTCVPLSMKHLSLGTCVLRRGRHITGDMCFLSR